MTQTIEQLQARVAEIEAENARLKVENEENSDVAGYHAQWSREFESQVRYLKEQLAAAQADNKRLRDALEYYATGKWEQKVFSYFNMTPLDSSEFIYESANRGVAVEAIAQPSDTSALDAYVAEKVKEYRPEFHQMREMLRAMQAGELTVSRGLEILDMWWAGIWNDSMLPPVHQDLIEEDSMPVEIIDRLRKQRDLAVEALKWIDTWAFDQPELRERARMALATIRESGAAG